MGSWFHNADESYRMEWGCTVLSPGSRPFAWQKVQFQTTVHSGYETHTYGGEVCQWSILSGAEPEGCRSVHLSQVLGLKLEV